MYILHVTSVDPTKQAGTLETNFGTGRMDMVIPVYSLSLIARAVFFKIYSNQVQID